MKNFLLEANCETMGKTFFSKKISYNRTNIEKDFNWKMKLKNQIIMD
jgi:hypothetical protein